jgi:hypothetical protein
MFVLVAVSSRTSAEEPRRSVVESKVGAPGLHQREFARWRAAFFLQLISWRAKMRQVAVRLPAIPCLCIAATTSSNVRSGCSAIRASNQAACFSNGERLLPVGFAAALPMAPSVAAT